MSAELLEKEIEEIILQLTFLENTEQDSSQEFLPVLLERMKHKLSKQLIISSPI